MKDANSKDKPSPSDTPTKRPDDKGHKAVVDNDADTSEIQNRAIDRQNERGGPKVKKAQ